MKYLIIDGQFLIYKSLFSHQRLVTDFEEREIISGIPFGFLKTIIDIKIKFMPNFIKTTFECHPLIKKQVYPPYKENRKKLDIDIDTEIEITRAILKSLHIPNLFSPGYEGEDIAKFIKKKITKKKNLCYFYTNDHDAFALIANNFILINNVDGEFVEIGLQELKSHYDITPKQARQIKIIEGCGSDNIIGFKGIGPTYAKYLIKKYKTAKKVVTEINETKSNLVKLNKIVKDNAKYLTTMTYVTKILCPEFVKNCTVKMKSNHYDLLQTMECRTLLKGASRRIINLIHKDQKKYYKKTLIKIGI